MHKPAGSRSRRFSSEVTLGPALGPPDGVAHIAHGEDPPEEAKCIVARMLDRVRGYPGGRSPAHVDVVDGVAALSSLALLLGALVGALFSVHALAAWCVFIYALFGFSTATLAVLGWRGERAVGFAPPLGLALTLILGALIVLLRVWVLGPYVFWVVALLAGLVHVDTVVTFVRLRGLSLLQPTSGAHVRYGRQVDRPRVDAPSPDARQRRALIRGESLLVGVGVVLVVSSALAIRPLTPGWAGLLGAISPAWYVGLLLVTGAVFVGQRLGGLFTGLPVVVLQLMLTLTPAIAYVDPRYSWTAKHVGVTSYVLLHGTVNPSIDIYQAWPGLFSGVAWLCKTAGLSSPISVAHWWPPVIDLATLLVVYQLARAVLRSPARAWMAATVFVVGYTIADADYFSPQSTGFLLTIATFAVVFAHRDEEPGLPPAGWMLILTMSIADAITHQLSPYMTTIGLVVLVVFGRAKTRWAPVVSLAPAAAWALIYFSYVKQHVSLSAFLNIFGNALTPGIAGGGPSPGSLANLVRLFEGGSALLIGVLALVSIARHRDQLTACLALCAASGAGLLVANSYGNEADFRVVLFALPWLAILAGRLSLTPHSKSAVLWPVVTVALLGLYLVADMGLDFVNVMRPGDVAAISKFELSAPVGSYLVIIGAPPSPPTGVSGRYNLVNELVTSNVVGSNLAHPLDARASYRQFMSGLTGLIRSVPSPVIGDNPRFYVLADQQSAAYLAAYNYASLAQYWRFADQFARSPSWRVVSRTSSAELFELRSRATP